MLRILFDSLRAHKRLILLPVAFAALLFPALGCASKVENTSIEIGGGMRKGEPPMCYQHRAEARATGDTGVYDILLHVNNSCRYAVDCQVYDDVTEKQNHVTMAANQAYTFGIAEAVPNKRVDLKFDCTWKP
ncbi:MAG TPA: hypothetical protein VMS65_16010 [Polyangiaceae bacterium]|nr:hypothetical protein [Polyangiaceae bacterium]